MFRFVFGLLFCFSIAACAAKKDTIKEVRHLPLTDQAKDLTIMPVYKAPIETGKAEGVAKGDSVPFDGILLSEDKATAAVELRIAYDELFRLSIVDRKYLLTVVEIQERTLQQGDERILKLEGQLRDLRTSWWENNKMEVGILAGTILGIAITATTGAVWSAIQD